MPKYEVILRRKCWDYTTVTVHAADLKAARRKATLAGRMGEDGEGGEGEWYTLKSPRQSVKSIKEVL